MDDIQELMIIKQFVIQLTPFLYGKLQGSVDITRTPDGYLITWNSNGEAYYAIWVNERGKSAGYADRAQSFCQAYLDDVLTEMQLRETMNDNVDNDRIETNTTYNAYLSKITLIKGE